MASRATLRPMQTQDPLEILQNSADDLVVQLRAELRKGALDSAKLKRLKTTIQNISRLLSKHVAGSEFDSEDDVSVHTSPASSTVCSLHTPLSSVNNMEVDECRSPLSDGPLFVQGTTPSASGSPGQADPPRSHSKRLSTRQTTLRASQPDPHPFNIELQRPQSPQNPHIDSPSPGTPQTLQIDSRSPNRESPYIDSPSSNRESPHIDSPNRESLHIDSPSSNRESPHIDSPSPNRESPHIDSPSRGSPQTLQIHSPSPIRESPQIDAPKSPHLSHRDVPSLESPDKFPEPVQAQEQTGAEISARPHISQEQHPSAETNPSPAGAVSDCNNTYEVPISPSFTKDMCAEMTKYIGDATETDASEMINSSLKAFLPGQRELSALDSKTLCTLLHHVSPPTCQVIDLTDVEVLNSTVLAGKGVTEAEGVEFFLLLFKCETMSLMIIDCLQGVTMSYGDGQAIRTWSTAIQDFVNSSFCKAKMRREMLKPLFCKRPEDSGIMCIYSAEMYFSQSSVSSSPSTLRHRYLRLLIAPSKRAIESIFFCSGEKRKLHEVLGHDGELRPTKRHNTPIAVDTSPQRFELPRGPLSPPSVPPIRPVIPEFVERAFDNFTEDPSLRSRLRTAYLADKYGRHMSDAKKLRTLQMIFECATPLLFTSLIAMRQSLQQCKILNEPECAKAHEFVTEIRSAKRKTHYSTGLVRISLAQFRRWFDTIVQIKRQYLSCKDNKRIGNPKNNGKRADSQIRRDLIARYGNKVGDHITEGGPMKTLGGTFNTDLFLLLLPSDRLEPALTIDPPAEKEWEEIRGNIEANAYDSMIQCQAKYFSDAIKFLRPDLEEIFNSGGYNLRDFLVNGVNPSAFLCTLAPRQFDSKPLMDYLCDRTR